MKHTIKPHADYFSPTVGVIILIIAIFAMMYIENF
jgi:hypothetical protein